MDKPFNPHVVIFPFMAQGHTLPLVDLSKALSQRHIKVTIITTPSNSLSIVQCTADHPDIAVTEIPFPAVHGLPKGCENTTELPSMAFLVPFLEATKQLQKPFEQVLDRMFQSGTLPICVISDFFLGWTLASCHLFGVPRLVFHGMGVLSMVIVKSAWVHAASLSNISSSEPLFLPGLDLPFVLTAGDLPVGVNTPDHDDPFSLFLSEAAEAEVNSWGVVVNSYKELEGTHISTLESFYNNGAKAWCLGPLSLYDTAESFHSASNQHQDDLIMKWLDKHTAAASVVYVSFGTQADVSDEQLDEVAGGLEDSGLPFLWVVRSTAWTLPDGMEERVKGKGLIVRKWVDQRSILKHRSTGGFLSHCGWNSVLESVTAGVPILALPMMAEQFLNAKIVAEGFGAGVRIEAVQGSDEVKTAVVSRRVIGKAVKELMEGEKGRIARDRVRDLGRVALQAVEERGSSWLAMNELLDQLFACRLK
ncbi:hypothetical protein U1Q18_018483 [Sarracenia purpurea var. burkii]